MNADDNTIDAQYPYQMTKEEFACWWAKINDQTANMSPTEIPQIIYLGKDSVEQTD